MADAQTDRNLLFGILALQLDLIDAAQLADACSGWAARREGSLADVLADRGWIGPEDRIEVERLLDRKLRRHAGDPAATLARVADEQARAALAGVADEAIRASIAGPTSTGGHVLLSTIAHVPEGRDRYTLTRLHATGGLGRVWLARDAELGRDVALKELKPERAGDPVLWARFLEEAKIAGQLEHPNIVPVHELVRPAAGRHPFYTMRFVRGRTLVEASRAYHRARREGRAEPMEFRELLHAFLGVCNAVGYAHARGVIHRDLKGQNVVLGDFGEVVVLDWGLAKLVDRPEDTITPGVDLQHDASRGETVAGQALGTPAYMAPEQAEGRWDRVDRRSDVYGLGAILFELLAGTPPFSGDDTTEVLRRVVHEPPTSPRAANPDAPRALEAVCLKALSKRPEDRYPTAAALADEVKHVLADEPVLAYREPVPARLGRWARRHRPLVAGAAALLATATVGLTIGAVALGRANARIDEQRQAAEANFRKARAAVDEYFTAVSESTLFNVPGLQPLRKELLDAARRYYEEFLRDRGDDPAVRAEAAEAWYRVGFVQSDIESPSAALRSFERASALYEALTRDHPGVVRYPYKWAMCLNDLGNQQKALGRRAEALRTHERSLVIRQRLAREHPGEPEYRKELAIAYSNIGHCTKDRGRLDEAMAHYREAEALQRGLVSAHPAVADYRWRLASNLQTIASLQETLGRHDEALASLGETVDLLETLAREGTEATVARPGLGYRPNDLDVRFGLGFAQRWIGQIHGRRAGRLEDAVAAYRRAIAVLDPLARENPTVSNYQLQAAYADCYLAQALLALGREAEAVGPARRALGRFDAIGRSELTPPYDRACVLSLCSTLVGLGPDGPSAEEQEARRRLADEAVSALRETLDGGYSNFDYLDQDTDLDPIRGREDVRAIIDEARARANRPGGAAPPPP